jgi:hypothetical protein
MSSNLPKLGRVAGLARVAGLVGVAALVGIASAAWAQVYVPGGAPVAPYYGAGGYAYGYNDPGAGSTPAGSYLTGMANAIRAEGQYNLLSSEAAINLEEAAKREIENRQRWTNAYFEMRRVNEAYTHPKRTPRPPEAWARLAHEAAPSRLPPTVLDPVSGRIYWPSTLMDPLFNPNREALEQLFAQRAAAHGAIGIEGYNQIRGAVDDALAKLKTNIRAIDTQHYIEARNFLTSLAYEANFPSG